MKVGHSLIVFDAIFHSHSLSFYFLVLGIYVGEFGIYTFFFAFGTQVLYIFPFFSPIEHNNNLIIDDNTHIITLSAFFVLFLSTWMVPQEYNVPMSIGNVRTCTMQGFLGNLFFLLSSGSNSSLAVACK